MLTALGTLAIYFSALLVLCGFLLAATLVHEAGHVVAGLISGFEIFSVRVGPINLRLNKMREWGLERRTLLNGFVIAQFHNVPGPQAPWQCFAFLVGGSAANLCSSLVLFPFSFKQTVVSAILGCLAVASAFAGLLNLIPFKSKLGYTDGAKISWLIFSESKREALIFRLSLKALLFEIVSLGRSHKLDEALAKMDDLIRRSSEIWNPSSELTELLSNLRPKIEAMQGSEAAAPTETAEV